MHIGKVWIAFWFGRMLVLSPRPDWGQSRPEHCAVAETHSPKGHVRPWLRVIIWHFALCLVPLNLIFCYSIANLRVLCIEGCWPYWLHWCFCHRNNFTSKFYIFNVLLSFFPFSFFLFFFFFFFFCLFRAALAACGGSQSRGWIRAAAAGHSHSLSGSKPCLQPTPQLMATSDPQPTRDPTCILMDKDSFPLHHNRNSPCIVFLIACHLFEKGLTWKVSLHWHCVVWDGAWERAREPFI